MLKLFKAARLAGIPILAIRTADQNATIQAIKAEWDEFVLAQWDAARGVTPVNKAGQQALAKADIKSDDTINFVEAMGAAQQLPPKAILFAHNAQRQLHTSEPLAVAASVQSVCNVRDTFKMNFRMLVLLTPYGFVPPSELEHDLVTLDHALPGSDVLKTVVEELFVAAKKNFEGLPDPTPESLTRSVDAISGLSKFEAEQVTAMSLTPTGIDLDALWERKRVTIEQTRGLKVYRGKERFDDIVGLENVKARLRQRLTGRRPIGVVVWVDEIDKVLANVEHDTSGVRMDQLRTLLAEMEDNEWEGVVLAGLPGGGKSLLGKAFGNEAGVPTISLDLAAMEGSLVGESEARLRQAMAVIKAVGGGSAFFVATSNNATIMRPELQRRFTGGFFFFDVMTAEERRAAWTFYLTKYGLDATQPLPPDDGWTAAEVRNCAREAWNCRISLAEAAQYIIPVAQARAEEFEGMRRYANGKYLGASKAGTYKYTKKAMATMVRAIALHPIEADTIVNMQES